MKAIIVDDEPIMLKHFSRVTEDIPDLNLLQQFRSPEDALEYVTHNRVDLAFLDIEMPGMNGITLAKHLREQRNDILIVFISAYDDYIRESNKIGGDYYIIKPYDRETIVLLMERLRLLVQRQAKSIYIQTFGTFNVLKNGKPISLTGKAKEILAYVVSCRGKEVSHQTIYADLWEDRTFGNSDMVVFFNALRRLRTALEKEGLSDLLISTRHGLMANTSMFDCDYYDWLEKNARPRERFEGEFLSEYSWAEPKLSDLLSEWW